MLKSALLASVLGLAFITPASADLSDQMKNSKYCRNNSSDVICMGPESQKMRSDMMAMTKEKAMENRTKYCQDGAGGTDPICDPKMMTDATGY